MSVVSSRPRSARSRTSAPKPELSWGRNCVLRMWKLLKCVSQLLCVTITQRVPASISRRAIRHDWPSVCRPYSSRIASGSAEMSKAVRVVGRRHEVERLLLERAQGLRAGVCAERGPLAVTVDPVEQGPPMVQPAGVDRQRREQIGNGKAGRARVSFGHEGGRRRTEVRRTGRVVHLEDGDIRRHGSDRPALAGDDRSVRGPLVVRLQVRIEPGRGGIAGEHVMVGQSVPRIIVRERPQERELIPLPGQSGEMLADLQARRPWCRSAESRRGIREALRASDRRRRSCSCRLADRR